MVRYTKKDGDGRYYIESANGKLENDIHGRTYGEAINRLAEFENADVVPKSEYDNLKMQFDALDSECDRLEKAESEKHDKIIEAKAEVAREIFEEIEKVAFTYYIDKETDKAYRAVELAFIAELKKKYTEGENEDQRGSN